MTEPVLHISSPLRGFNPVDAIILVFVAACFSVVVYIGSGWHAEMLPSIEIELNPARIPLYAANSVLRILIAYMLSLVFSIWYGYAANKSRLHEKIMIPLLDVLQSIPVLSFLPGVALATISLFPGRRIGLELTSILLIFTGQVWNMAFSYYNSIATVPKDLKEVGKVFRHSRLTRFITLDLPFSATGLIWNSMMSVAGGWFFLMACEMFTLRDRDFRLPGLGSYIQTAANQGEMLHIFYGLGAIVVIILIFDTLLWRPLIAWSQKFRFATASSEEERESVIIDLIRRSTIVKRIRLAIARGFSRMDKLLAGMEGRGVLLPFPLRRLLSVLWIILLVLFSAWSLIKMHRLLTSVPPAGYLQVLSAALYSFLRTSLAIIVASAWTVPVGVWIGLNPRIARVLQPLVQVVASVPATALFPVIMVFLINAGGGLAIGSIFLMLLGTQWYILFNVIAGASAVPRDLIDAAELYGVKGFHRWKVLILPSIFPYLVTGLITATGGAWNATIVSEYVMLGGRTMTTPGLGSSIAHSAARGEFGLLLLSTLTMILVVVAINRFFWKRLLMLAAEKYRLE